MDFEFCWELFVATAEMDDESGKTEEEELRYIDEIGL